MQSLSIILLLLFVVLSGWAVLAWKRIAAPGPKPAADPPPDPLAEDALFSSAAARISRVQQWLIDAELNWSAGSVLAWWGLGGAAAVMVGLAVGATPGWITLGTLVALAAPAVALLLRRRARLRTFQEQLPEAVSLIARAVKAGLSIEQSLELAQEMARGRLAHELAHCSRQLSLGLSLSGAMSAFARRTRLREVSLLSSILSVHRATGGMLVGTLERTSVMLRDRLTFQRQVLAASSAGRLSSKIIAPLAPVLFVLLMFSNPEHTTVFFTTPLGRSFLVLGIVLQFVGISWILYLIREDD